MKTILYDLSNWARVTFEKDQSGSAVRTLWWDVLGTSPDQLKIFVADGNRCNDRRRAFFPEYKMTRARAVDSFYETLGLFKELLAYAPSNVGFIELEGYEADDVIADLSKKFSDVIIMSTDKDLLAIPNATNPMANNKWEDRDLVVAKKICVGDPSDNFKGITGFGEGSWNKLSRAEKLRMKEFVLNPNEATLNRAVECPNLSKRTANVLMDVSREWLSVCRRVVEPIAIDTPYEINFGKNDVNTAEKLMEENFC